MIPLGPLSRRGRLQKRLASALAEPDPAIALQRLRELWPALGDKPAMSAPLWLPLLTEVLNGPVTHLLTVQDLASLATTGASIAEHPGTTLTLPEAVGPLLAAHDARREPQAAAALLTRMYRSPSSTDQEKETIARTLAARGARGDEHLAIYTDHLSGPQATLEPNMRAVLSDSLRVGFEVDPLQVKRAGELAERLRAARITLGGLELALGYARLIVDRRPNQALPHLDAAVRADPADRTAFVGLLSAWIRVSAHDPIATAAARPERPSSKEIEELIELSATLAWLDDPLGEGPVPATVTRLAGFGISAQAGDQLAYAIGRLWLLEGDARRAAELLVPLARDYRGRPQWSYHAAWALSLIGDRAGVAQRFFAVRRWIGRWTMGCLLMDADPNLVDTVAAELAKQFTPAGYAKVATVRVALARHLPAPDWVWRPGKGILEEELESFRTGLGRQLIERDQLGAARTLTRPEFRRLPLADQLWWSGIVALPTEPDRGRLLLERSDRLGHPRAALALAAHLLERERHDEAHRLLARFSWRTDPTMELLRNWASACAGDDDAAARVEHLARQGNPRARYALGSVYLRRAAESAKQPDRRKLFSRQAAGEFRAAAAGSVPRDAETLACCAELAGTEDMATIAGQAEWSSRFHPWVGWLTALSQLAGDPGAVPIEACEHLVQAIEAADHAHPDALAAVSCGLLGACLSTDDRDRAIDLAALIGRLANRTPDAAARHRHGLAAALIERRKWTDGEAPVENGNTPLLLVKAEQALETGSRPAAAGYLRMVLPGPDPAEHEICRTAADLLDDVPVDIAEAIPAEPRVALARSVLHAAALAERAPDQCLALLVPAMREHGLTGIVDMRENLPQLCAAAGKQRSAPRILMELVRTVAANLSGDLDPLVLARCASAVGDHELAGTLWRRALAGRPDATASVREEYSRVLRHQAVSARRAGRDLDAAHYLLLAARATTGCRLDRVSPTDDEINGLYGRFRAEPRWAELWKCLEEAVNRGQDAEALTFFMRLQSIAGAATSPDHELAATIQLEVCADRLLSYLLPGDRGVPHRSGRHRPLEHAIKESPRLLRALLAGDRDEALRAWSHCLRERGADLRFQHTLAVLYRERALATEDSPADVLVFATVLWALLLSTSEFWTQPDRQRLEKVARELFTLHVTRGNRELSAGQPESALPYLRCLKSCQAGAAALTETLGTYGLSYRHTLDDGLLAQVCRIAETVLDGWCADTVRAAEQSVDDPEAIDRLPDGIRKNYEGGLRRLEPFARAGVPAPSLLRAGLDWYNDWRECLYTRKEFDSLGDLSVRASLFANRLAPVSVKNRAHEPENQSLSRHYLFCGFVASNSASSVRDYELSLAWQPTNRNTRELLTQLSVRLARDDGDEARAEELLRTALTEPGSDPVREDFATQLADLLNSRAVALVKEARGLEDKFGTALVEINPAARPRLSEVDSLYERRPPAQECAVCGDPKNAARRATIGDIRIRARNTDGRRVNEFWEQFDKHLCQGCAKQLRSIGQLHDNALDLVEQAHKLDPDNSSIRGNLDLLRTMNT